MKPLWWITKDGDAKCRELYERHYSSAKSMSCRTKRPSKLFCGPGEKIVLRTWFGTACFVWSKHNEQFAQKWQKEAGVCCTFFRNESDHRSSELIRQADAIADFCWPRLRHYTYVDAGRIKSTNPGCCFKAAGWRQCGKTKGGLIILEKP